MTVNIRVRLLVSALASTALIFLVIGAIIGAVVMRYSS